MADTNTKSKSLTDAGFIHSLSDTNSVFLNAGDEISQMYLSEFRKHLNDNDEQILQDLAFYIDINKASSKGATRVDTGGNMNMRQLWEDAGYSVLMDKNGNCARLNPSDNRYLEDGTAILNSDGTLVTAYAKCDLMKVRPKTYGRIQTIIVGSTSIARCWFSLVPLPGGYEIPQMVIGKEKLSLVDGVARSIPGAVPSGDNTIYSFWDKAQLRSKNHGLAGLDFRNYLLFYMMSKYGYRDSQNCVGSDGTKIWGVGLDGTETTTQADGWNKFLKQREIKTGQTLSLGESDGNVAATDADNNTCHCVNVDGFENPWGQFWEMIQGLCSVGNDVYFWRGNTIPHSTPTADTFTNIDHVKLTRPASDGLQTPSMNIITATNGQGVYMIPNASATGINYGDNFWYNNDGQLWLFGGGSVDGSNCGLAGAGSGNAWSASNASFSARLAYYGTINMVTPKRLAELAA